MKGRYLFLCGLSAPILFTFTTILGGALRPGYSHISDTVSELFSPGSPNKPLLDALHTIFALLLTMFGIGILQYIRRSVQTTRIGIAGAWLYTTMGVLSLSTATVFPQDAWGSPVTFAGEMHMIVSGVIGILSMLSFLLVGIWFHRAGIFPGFGTYSFLTVGASALLAGFFVANVGSPIMGLAERMAIFVGFLWTFILALLMVSTR